MKRTAENTQSAGPVTGKCPPGFKDVVTVRVKDQKFGPSKAGLPMITLDLEIVEPKLVTCPANNKEYEMAGLELTAWVMLNEKKADGSASPNLSFIVNEWLPRLGFTDGIDDANPLYHEEKNPDGLKFTGLCFQAMVGSEERIEKKKLPNGQYVDVIDPATGKPLSGGWQFTLQTKDILRRVEAPTGEAF